MECYFELGGGFNNKGTINFTNRKVLNKGDVILQCDTLTDNTEKLVMLVESTGRVNIYDKGANGNGNVTFSTNTYTSGVAEGNYLVFQNDGNLVLYNNDNTALWSYQTNKDGKFILGSVNILGTSNNGNLMYVSNDFSWLSQGYTGTIHEASVIPNRSWN